MKTQLDGMASFRSNIGYEQLKKEKQHKFASLFLSAPRFFVFKKWPFLNKKSIFNHQMQRFKFEHFLHLSQFKSTATISLVGGRTL